MKFTMKLVTNLCVMAAVTLSGAAAAEVFNDGRDVTEKVLPNEIRATDDARSQKAAAEDAFKARLDTVDQELASLREQIEARSPNGEMIDAAIGSLETKRDEAATALNGYEKAASSDWAIERRRTEQAFAAMNAALDQAYNEVLAH